MSDYTVERIAERCWAIDDPWEDSFYLIEGDERALLIDTGAYPKDILPLISSLTNKPVELTLTHAHVDHMYHAGEFENVYVGGADLRAWRTLGPLYVAGFFLYKIPPRRVRHGRFIPIEDGHVFDLGGCTVRAIVAPGHTPGSMIYACDRDNTLFTGDAFGSGEASWMWLPGCLSTSRYRDNLAAFLPKLEPYAGYRWLGGHRLQGIKGEKHPHARALGIQVPRDMRALCGDMLEGRDAGKPVHIVPLIPMRVYSHGDASMVARRSQIK